MEDPSVAAGHGEAVLPAPHPATEKENSNAVKSRRELLEEWKASRAKTPKTVAPGARRVPAAEFMSERKQLQSGAVRVQVATPAGHLATPALRVALERSVVADDDATTPVMRTKAASRVDATAAPTPMASLAPASAKPVPVQPTPKERKQVCFASAPVQLAPNTITQHKAVSRVDRFVPAKRAVPAFQRSDSVSMRLVSALHAAHRHTQSGNVALARRIYVGLLNDRERFTGVETSAQYWVQFALLEEHCHNYVEALNAYQRGLEHGAQPNGEVESNLYVFMMRMDERLERATRGECGPAGLKALQDFVALLRTKEPAPVAREETEEAAAKHNEAQKLEEAQIKEEAPVEIRNAQQIAALAALDLQQLMQASAAPAEVAARADAAATELERTGPRRSERLAGKERKNYADPSTLLPWWLRDDGDWQY